MPTVREETIRILRHFEMTTIFGNPGSTEMPMFKDFPSDFSYVLGLQEATAVGVAEGYAGVQGRAALVNLHTAPGVGNAMGNIIAAFHHRTPLVITAGQQIRAMIPTEPFLYNRDAVELPKPWVKWSYEPARAADVPAALARAYYVAMLPPRGPVFVSIPMDDWDQPAEAVELRTLSYRTAPDSAAIDELVQRMAKAKRIALVAGPAVDREGAWEPTVRLAERLQAGVWGSPLSQRAGFPEDHPQYQGALAPAQGVIAKQLQGYDFVLVLGAPVFSYYPYVPGPYLPSGTTLFQVTDDPNEASRAPVGSSIVGSIRLAVELLVDRVSTRQGELPPPRRQPPVPEERVPFTPDLLFERMARLLPADAVIVDESPSTRPALQKYLPIRRSGGFYTTGGGGLGYGMPAAVGIQIAEPSRRVVCVMGDGSSFYSIQALWTAAQHQAPVVFVVLDNSQYTILKSFGQFTHTGDKVPGLDLPGLDIVSVANGLGCAARSVGNVADLERELKAALDSRGPSVLRVPMDRAVPPLIKG